MVFNKISKDNIIQFYPNRYKYLLTKSHIIYNGKELKSEYIINIMNDLISKYYFHKDDLIEKEITFNLWSELLKKKYGSNYNFYINYLINTQFIYLVSNYFSNKKSRSYRLNINDLVEVKKCKLTDKVLLKKLSPEFLKETYLKYNNSPIPIDIRTKLVEDLYKINIDSNLAIEYLSDIKNNKDITYNKYMRNYITIINLKSGNLFFKFDEYGRMHTNFTVLKKEIRKKYLTINNEEIDEIDLSNSQPLFLTLILKEKMSKSELFSKEVSYYIELVKNGLIYDYIQNKLNFKDRNDAKIFLYRILFGNNNDNKKENLLFKQLFPIIFNFIKLYKEQNNDYKSLSHKLQLLESDFIFNKVIRHIMTINPNIILFTIHDSISFPKKYINEVSNIFNFYKNKLISF
jgi:hypothetical protein